MRRFNFIMRNLSATKRLSLLHKQIILPHFCTSVELSRFISYTVTAANFNQEVLQSQQAICLVYYINTRGCTAYLQLAEKLVDELNLLTNRSVSTPCESKDAMCKETKEKLSSWSEEGYSEKKEANEYNVNADLSRGTGEHEREKAGKEDCATLSNTSSLSFPCTSTCESSDAPANDKRAHHAGNSANTEKSRMNVWLKLCTINADENRNLASTFSVERAKLPVTYFIMQSTIIDRVVGQISENRLQNILYKFLEHYQKELNVDLLSKRNRESLRSADGMTSPLPRATSIDLVSDTSTQFLQNKIMAALVGSEMIRLPEEIAEAEGLKKTIQQAKQKASKELCEHQELLGMNLRKLTERELQEKYYKSLPFVTYAIISALETLYLARMYSSVGNIDRKQVEWAHTSLLNDFSAVMSNPTIRRVVALVEANLLKGDLLVARTRIQKANRYKAESLQEQQQELEEEKEKLEQRQTRSFTVNAQDKIKDFNDIGLDDEQYCSWLLHVIDEHIDTRLYTNTFPSPFVEELFTKLKAEIKAARLEVRSNTNLDSTNVSEYNSTTITNSTITTNDTSYYNENKDKNDENELVNAHVNCRQRAKQIQTVLMCILQLHSADPASQMMRSRLSSLLY